MRMGLKLSLILMGLVKLSTVMGPLVCTSLTVTASKSNPTILWYDSDQRVSVSMFVLFKGVLLC